MPNWVPPLQQDAVMAFVSAAAHNSCAIVHPPSKTEASLFADGEGWSIYASLRSAPSAAEGDMFESIGLKASTRKVTMRYGPLAGQTIEVPLVSGTFRTLKEAAASGLALVRFVVGDPQSWLWIAPREYDDRDEPPAPPTVWPPPPSGYAADT